MLSLCSHKKQDLYFRPRCVERCNLTYGGRHFIPAIAVSQQLQLYSIPLKRIISNTVIEEPLLAICLCGTVYNKDRFF